MSASFPPGAPRRAVVVEVGLRDGLQAEQLILPTATKLDLARRLIAAGVRHLELTSFVSPRAVPQLADAEELLARLGRPEGVEITALVPNAKGAERALRAGVDGMVVFLSASESHNRKNLNRPIARSLEDVAEVARLGAAAGVPVHAALSVAFGCPFEGEVPVAAVVAIAQRLAELGIRRLSLGDTTGMATPPLVRERVRALREALPELELALHFHNTRGIGLVNAWVGLELGIERFESSIGGLGGCPFAAGATGNVCTEDLVYLLHESGIDTGIDLEALISVARDVERLLGRPLPGQVMKAGPRLKLHPLDAVATARG
ncbi:MAG: hydroxymethylglutaryl-CoA lyase [Geminicoccaceae bacterium]|nr:hydroxymethylglutaryl-CoA lyase [Geminicoccaceae bacterium]MCX7629915.1 hydroxymethylglutaryl-CoA lyase [Geminicoccaceae bacterium]MDW8124658.1 hydroxymethylglutaryl-CoA lyase [Geminicoccaceae bacterium]